MSLDLQNILDAAQNGDDRPAAIKAAITDATPTREDVDALLDEAIGKFNELSESDPTDADATLGLELLAEVSTVARTVQTTMDAEVEKARTQRAELASKVNGEDPAPKDDAADEAPAEDPAEGAEVVAEAEAVTEEAAAEPVVASGGPAKRFHLSNIKATPPTTPTGGKGVAITAAADVRGFGTGQDLEGMDGLVAATMARVESMPRGLANAHVRAGIAQVRAEWPEALVASGVDADAQVEYAADEKRLTGGSLVASGGWGAPSETMYDLAPMLADPAAGILSVPEIAVKRGGIRTAGGVDFATVWAGNAGLVQTEAEAIANTAKTLYRPSVPTFTEVRADVIYSGLEVGFLQDNAYPEVTKQTLEGLLAVHAHRVNAETIERMVAHATTVDLSATLGPSATGSALNGLGLVGTDYRYKFRATPTTSLEAVAPIWLKEVVRADLALRTGDGQFVQVTDQQIDGYFAARGMKVQWVYDYQDAFVDAGAGFGGTTALTEYPDTANVLVYAAGTFVRGRGDVVNLDTVYDSSNIKKNDFLQMFMEEKILVHKRAHQALNVKIALGVNGTTGIGQVLDGNGKIAPVTP